MMKEQENYNIDKDQDNQINLRDILDLLILRWYWFALSVVVCLSGAYLYLSFTAPIYTRTATVLIKDEKKGGAMSEMSSFMELGMLGGGSNVENEVFVFKSKKLMQDVVIRLKLNIDYSTKKMFRTVNLYGKSPVEVEMIKGSGLNSSSFIVKPLSDSQYELFDFELSETEKGSKDAANFKKTLNFNDTISTPVGVIVVKHTNLLDQEYIGEEIKVNFLPVKKVAMAYLDNVNAAPTSKTTSLIKLSLNDTNIQRAEDFLNTLIAVYNEDAVNDKNQIAQNTSQFIDERLVIISRELGVVDQDIETYKKENKLTDIAAEAGLVLETSTKYKAEYIEVENQINVAKFIHEYLVDPSKSRDLIPANTGVSDAGVENQIAIYNESILKRDKLSDSSSDKNPIVKDLNNSLLSMKKSIIRSVDNLLASLDIKRSNLLKEEKKTTNRIESVPSQEKYVLTVARQQKIKEELYLFLLNKREENALSLA
ncbi:MAG: Wzz/FepE/Etk N-terminal domain-containing protein, partial [Oscillospiraceae bacterium]